MTQEDTKATPEETQAAVDSFRMKISPPVAEAMKALNDERASIKALMQKSVEENSEGIPPADMGEVFQRMWDIQKLVDTLVYALRDEITHERTANQGMQRVLYHLGHAYSEDLLLVQSGIPAAGAEAIGNAHDMFVQINARAAMKMPEA